MKIIQTIMVGLVILATVVGTAILVLPVYFRHQEAKQNVAAKKAELERVRGELRALQQEIQDLENKPAATEKVAREKFRYCREGEVIYEYSE